MGLEGGTAGATHRHSQRRGARHTAAPAAGGRGGWRDWAAAVADRAAAVDAGRPAMRRPKQRGSESQEYLKKEQKELLQVVRDRVALREEQQKKRVQDPRKPFTLQARQTAAGLQLTPDEKYVIATCRSRRRPRPRRARSFRTTSPIACTRRIFRAAPMSATIRARRGWPSSMWRRARSRGWTTGRRRLPRRRYRDSGGCRDRAAAGAAAAASNEREVQMSAPLWSEDGTKAVISARAADNKDRWLLALDVATGKTRVLANQHDDAWVGGPQGTANVLGWMKNDREVYFVSEKTGYAHLYAVPFDGGEPRALTSGKWEVLTVRQSKDKSKFYLVATAEGPCRPVPVRDAGRRRRDDAHFEGAGRARRDALARRAVDRRRLLVHQPAARALCAGEPAGAGTQAADHVALGGIRAVRVAGCADRAGAGARRRQGAGAHVQAGEL